MRNKLIIRIFVTLILSSLIFVSQVPYSVLSVGDDSIEDFKKVGSVSSYTDSLFKWTVEFPSDWRYQIAFENPDAKGVVIRKRIIFYTTSNEIITVDVWENKVNQDLLRSYELLEAVFQREQDRVNQVNGKIAGLPAILSADLKEEKENIMHKSAIFQFENFIYRINYSIKDSQSDKYFITFIKSFKLEGKSGEYNLEKMPKLKDKNSPKVKAAYAEDKCGPNQEYELQGNPFPCASICSITKTNCVWWAIYKRPDLKTKIVNGSAGASWINQAEQADLPIYDDPVQGSIAVWGTHVAYVNSVSNSNNFNISEMNCDNSAYPGPRDTNVTKTYGNPPYVLTLHGFIGGADECSSQIANLQINSGQNFTCSLPNIIILPETIFHNGSNVHITAQ